MAVAGHAWRLAHYLQHWHAVVVALQGQRGAEVRAEVLLLATFRWAGAVGRGRSTVTLTNGGGGTLTIRV